MPPVVSAIDDLRQRIAAARAEGRRVGFVPTMGALHAGHASLVTRARQDSGFVVVSIFVNPTQFGPQEDFSRYPRTLAADLAVCDAAGADLVWNPTVDVMYPTGNQTIVDVPRLGSILEGEVRPTHFRGVATVVMKLLMAVVPDVAFFGQKDFQQQLIIRTMVRDLFLPFEITTCPTAREEDGLAMSSRNRYLSPSERLAARSLSQAIFHVRDRLIANAGDLPKLIADTLSRLRSTPLVHPDYLVVADPDTLAPLETPQQEMVALVAARVGTTRLIDNCLISRDSSPGH